MVTEFNRVNQNKIACCIVDNRHNYTSGWATEVSINVSDFLAHRFTVKGYDVFIDNDENELLRHVADQGYSHAVVVAMGTSLGLNDRLFPAIENICRRDFFIAGHILDRNENSHWKNAYYELHHQFYIVRLEDFIELDYPEIGEQEYVKHRQIEPIRSETCLYNDHEVAEWIRPGYATKEYEMKLHGWNIIARALENDKTIIDLGQEIRDTKKYFYYEYDHVFTRTLADLYHNEFFCNNFFPSWNSDPLNEGLTFQGPVEQYITVGIGVYWVHNLNKIGFDDNTRVVFTDINNHCLNFMKALVEEWDGTNYPEFYRARMTRMVNGFQGNVDAYLDYTDKEWQAFVAKFPNWLDLWNRVKKLKFEYILIDYMGRYELSWINPQQRTLMNLSDVFTHCPYIHTQSLKYRIASENKLLNELRNVDPNIYLMLTSRAADGFHHDGNHMRFGAVEDFDLTDINVLRKTPWHEQDWSSPRMLG